ncbi:MAG: alkene reductase [Aquabacterium sp.]|nr:alkene reductase [Aquabacterium sp.]
MLFSPIEIGALSLQHRIVMPPLTRMRAKLPGNVPHTLNAEYYAQRASAGGLIIAEATQVCPSGQGYPATPGIHSEAQVNGWREVTDAVHARGGKIVLQLWHVGRLSHSSFQPMGQLPVAPSAIAAPGLHFSADWTQVPLETPRSLETHEVMALADVYREAATHALEAGFDGVELHAANGYLVEQFLLSSANQRTDQYGGSLPNRIRLLSELTQALIDAAGADRVGVRLSPFGFGQREEDAPLITYRYAIRALSEHKLAYLHLIEPRASMSPLTDSASEGIPSASELFRSDWPGVLIAAGGYDPKSAERAISRGQADAIAFGRLFIANPDLVDRIRADQELAPWHRGTFYCGGASGYTDYPGLPRAHSPEALA